MPQLGGLEIAVSNIAKELVKAGNRVTLIAGNSSIRCLKEIEPSGITVYQIPFFLPRVVTVAGRQRMIHSIYKSIFSPLIAPKSFFKFLNILKSTKPDIVNVHYIAENAAFCLLAKNFLDFKFIVNLHGNDIDRNAERSIFSQLVTKKTLAAADRVLSNSSDILRKAEKIQPTIKNKSVVAGNGIYLEEFESPPKYYHPRRYILSIANFVHKKGQDILIHAFRILHQKYPNNDLLLAGDGPELKKCIDLAEKLGLSDSIKFLGKVGRSRIPSLLAGCEVFVLTSRKEAFGIVILEALASKKPVVATRVGGVPEIIKHMENGILVEPESPKELASAIQLVITYRKLAIKLAENGYNTIQERFTWSKIVEKYMKEYSAALG